MISDYADPKCIDCDGEGHYDVARGEDSEDIPCERCFPNGYDGDED